VTFETTHTESLIQIGTILTSFGLQGEVVVSPTTDDPNLFLDLDRVYIGFDEDSSVAFGIERARIGQRKGHSVVFVLIESISNRERADSLRGQLLLVERSQLGLGDEEYLLEDLVGFAVQLESGDLVGHLKEVRRMPGQDLLVIDGGHRGELLIPDVPEFVDKGSIDDRILIVNPIEGLID
jgi:16S rRNA processing protein RimM